MGSNARGAIVAAAVVLLSGLVVACGADDTPSAAERATDECGESTDVAPVAASADAESSESSESSDSARPVSITVQWEGAWNEAAAVELFDRWDDAQPDVEVTVLPAAPRGAVPSRLRGAEPPTLARVPIDSLAALGRSGEIQPIERCVEPLTVALGEGLDTTVPLGRVDGVPWGVTGNVDALAMVYDRGVFDAAGLNPDRPPDSLRDLHYVATTIRDGVGIDHPIAGYSPWIALATQSIRPTVSEAARDYAQLGRDGLLLNAAAAAGPARPVLDGTAAMQIVNISQVWGYAAALAELGDSAPDLAVAPVPGATGPVAPLAGDVWTLSADALPEQARAAGELLSWLQQDEQQASLHLVTDLFPSSATATALPAVQDHWAQYGLLAQMWDVVAANQVGTSDWTNVPGMAGMVDRELGAAAAGESDVDPAWWRVLYAREQAVSMIDAGPGLAAELVGCVFPPDAPPIETDRCVGMRRG